MNATIEKFGYPSTLVRAFEHWLVLVRPAQPTLASLVLAANNEATAFGDLPAGAFTELKQVTATIERGLAAFRAYERINYLMLMMVDPHVHFHVIPRYGETQRFEDLEISDLSWPGPPRLDSAVALSPGQIAAVREAIAPLMTG